MLMSCANLKFLVYTRQALHLYRHIHLHTICLPAHHPYSKHPEVDDLDYIWHLVKRSSLM